MTWQPYADGTSGHQGDTSQRAEPDRRRRLQQARRFVESKGSRGVTWREYAEEYGLHHGVASSALSNLHRSGEIVRLAETRSRCGVYVVADERFIQGRDTVAHRTNRKGLTDERVREVVEKWNEDGFAYAVRNAPPGAATSRPLGLPSQDVERLIQRLIAAGKE